MSRLSGAAAAASRKLTVTPKTTACVVGVMGTRHTLPSAQTE
jgi:hypothetical protein